MPLPRRRLLPPMLAVGLLLAACGDADDASTAPSTTVSSTTAVSTTAPSDTTTTTAAPDIVDASIDTRLDQIVGWLNGEPFDEVDFEESFGDAFRAELTYDQLADVGGALMPSGPWAMVSEERGDDGLGLVARLMPADGTTDLELTLVVAPGDARIEGLFFAPAVDVEPAADVTTAADALAELGEVALGAFDVSTGECGAPIVDRGAEVQAPVGSAFKLWVLAAVVDAADRGELTWDDEVVIEDRFDSLPSGITQEEPDGSTLPVRELAERMISISDNTATDILIDLVGRDAVEAKVVETGHAAPELNRPFFTTRELFVVKFDRDIRASYLAADETERRALLAGPVAEADIRTILTRAAGWTEPIEIEALEWFASPTDLCRVLVELVADEDARDVLSENPGIPDPTGRWSFIGFKGGSEPGVLNLSWLVEDADGASYVVAGSVWDTDAPLDRTIVTTRLGEVRELIGR